MVDQRRAPTPLLWWRSRRSAAFDIAVAVVVAALPALGTYVAMYAAGMAPAGYELPTPYPAIDGLRMVAGVASGLLLVLRRRFPVAIAAAVVAALAVVSQSYAAVVGLYTLAAYGRSRRVLAAIGFAAFVACLLPLPWTDPSGASPVPWVIVAGTAVTSGIIYVGAPILLGLYVGARRELVAGLRERAERLERERHLLAEQALAEERARIAREMHDVVAHRVSLMVLHAGALEATADDDPRRTANFTALIRSIGTQALDELRRVIGLLRVGDSGRDAAPLAPQPTLDDLPALVEQAQDPDAPVIYHATGDRRPLGTTVERTAYRVVQEALTNARKHARGAPVQVLVRYRPDAVQVAVTDTGRRHAADLALLGGGHGLAGMRERVAILGGTLEAGPCSDGGFRVRAVIPVDGTAPALETAT